MRPWRHRPLQLQRATSLVWDLTTRAEQFGALLVVRIAIAVTVLIVAAAVPGDVGIGVKVVAPVTAAYVAIAAVAEWFRRGTRVTVLNVQNVMLIVDVAYIALILAPSGGPHSQLVFLFYVHLIAVTLLGTHRTGLRVALYDSLLFVPLYTFSLSTEVSRLLGASFVQHPRISDVVLSVLAFWLVATSTAFFSWVNERELRRSKEELRALAEMGAALEEATCLEDIMVALLAKSTEAYQFARGAVVLTGGERAGPATPTAIATGQARPVALPDTRPDAVIGKAWEERGPVLVRTLDPQLDPLLDRMVPAARNVVVLPLMADGEPLGVLAVERGGPFGVKLPVRAVTMMSQFTAHASLALRNSRLRGEVERLAKEDGLTGLANRRVFEDVLSREVSRAHRSHEPLSLIVFDVDHFKQVNDTLGHPAGDDVLRHVAQSLVGAAREIDLVARYGGEEFTVILPNCGLEDAMGVAERMRTSATVDLRISDVTLSAGVATIPTNATDGECLIAAADEAMYKSKQAGRNRTTGSTRRLPGVQVRAH